MSPNYTIRRAESDDELRGARAVILGAMEQDLGYGYNPDWHWDLDHGREIYVDNERQAMYVAVDAEGVVMSTAAIRVGGPASPPHPDWLADRYRDRPAVAQLTRVATLPEHRKQGLARKLVHACQRFVRDDKRFRVIYAHTNTLVPAAEPFWKSLPITVTYDARGKEDDDRFQTFHFELDFAPAVAG